jgi:hypothetical protein
VVKFSRWGCGHRWVDCGVCVSMFWCVEACGGGLGRDLQSWWLVEVESKLFGR